MAVQSSQERLGVELLLLHSERIQLRWFTYLGRMLPGHRLTSLSHKKHDGALGDCGDGKTKCYQMETIGCGLFLKHTISIAGKDQSCVCDS